MIVTESQKKEIKIVSKIAESMLLSKDKLNTDQLDYLKTKLDRLIIDIDPTRKLFERLK